MTRRAARGAGSVALLWLLAATGTTATARDNDPGFDAAAVRASQASIGRVLADLELTDQHGRPFRLASLRGRPLVLSLVYTSCYYVCSGLTLHLRDVVRTAQEAVGAGRFSVLTVGFDSAHDTPPRMLAFGLERGIDSEDWLFASADAATINRLAGDVGFSWVASPAGFDHITQVTLVDADGRIVQQVYGPDFPAPQLIEPLKSLVLSGGLDRSTFQGVIDTVQLFCTVYDPVSGRYKLDYSMLIGAVPAFLMLGIVAFAIVMVGRRNR